jgi:hypothetical protein
MNIFGVPYWLWFLGTAASSIIAYNARESCGLKYLYHDDGSPVIRGWRGVVYWAFALVAWPGWFLLMLKAAKLLLNALIALWEKL